jgi:hypothetical protein
MAWAEENGIDIYDNSWGCSKTENGSDVWVTKDLKEIKISEMDDKHLYFAYKKFSDERLQKEIILRLLERHGIK